MDKLYSAAEIVAMNLPGLPTTKKAILTRAEKEEWYSETRIGLGGVRKVFKIPALYQPGYTPPNHNAKSSAELRQEAINERASKVAAEAAETLGDQVDPERLALAIQYVDSFLLERGIAVPPKRRSEIIVIIYHYLKGNSGESEVKTLLKLVA